MRLVMTETVVRSNQGVCPEFMPLEIVDAAGNEGPISGKMGEGLFACRVASIGGRS